MRPSSLSKPSKALRRPGVKLDNVVLVPASQLPFKAHWQAIANTLPSGSVLVYLPKQKKQQRIVHNVVSQLQARGHQVSVLR